MQRKARRIVNRSHWCLDQRLLTSSPTLFKEVLRSHAGGGRLGEEQVELFQAEL